MKHIFIYFGLLALLSSCGLAPCLTKDSFVESSESTFKKFKDNKETFSTSDWNSMDEAYKNFLENCYPKFESEMSNEELKNFWLSTSQYFIKRGYKGPEMEESLKELYGQHLEVYMKKMGTKYSKQFEDLLHINIDNAVDKIFDFLKDVDIKVEHD